MIPTGSRKIVVNAGRKLTLSSKDVSGMSASEINKEKDKLDKHQSDLTRQFIDTGRGSETAMETAAKSDPLATQQHALHARYAHLNGEIQRRYGQRISRLPKGFGPIKNAIGFNGKHWPGRGEDEKSEDEYRTPAKLFK